MMCSFTSLISLVILFTTALSAPVEKGDGLHYPSSHRGHHPLHRALSHRMRGALAKRPMNLTFSPIDSAGDFIHVEYGVPTQSQASYSRFSTTLSKLGSRDEAADANHDRFSGGDAQTVMHFPDTYGGRHVMISISDSVAWALQQKGVSQENMPQYVRQNVHAVDQNTGNQYLLMPDDDAKEPLTVDYDTIMITMKPN